ncbi:glycoside hydrolase family 16 protein [Croceicoccus mobilis]|uniref:Beta-glucanase n=1 Tax=Croceicoccus mobilis TaxID=1703339 RepID=A0A916YXT9_9SPHN|nr:glycoside hydrolase family 16 protein [Croceicoccus mobilis]GGD66097.1 beta-glucanase [Croceicoccus mobilis]
MKLLTLLAATALVAPVTAHAQDNDDSKWQLVWSDEFDGDAIDPMKWELEENCWGGGNNERQCYTDSPRNAHVEDGHLVITARKESMTGPALPLDQRGGGDVPDATKPFTSARLTTRDRAAWRYGRIEVRAELPQGQGTWPAIWMLPESGAYGRWAASGEIDILEAVNLGTKCADCPTGKEDTVLGTLHFGGFPPENAHKGEEIHYPEVLLGFHTFAIEWSEGRIEWFVDGKSYQVQTAGDWYTPASDDPLSPFDRRFHLILNLAIGGGLAESRGLKGVDETGFPKQMKVDWVRVWQCGADQATGKACER